MEDLLSENIDFILNILPFVIVTGALPALIKILFGCRIFESSGTDFDISINSEFQESKEPEKPKETVVKTYVINSPVKMKPVSKFRDIPKLCPYCLGVPDNDVRCSYCGVRF